MNLRCGLLLALVVLPGVITPAAHARDTFVRSFDDTPINTHFFPARALDAGERAPTIMIGPGWGLPGDSNPEAGELSDFRQAGYNVVTWDPRGFWASGGTVMIDHPNFEARDAQAIIDHVAAQPEAQLDAPGDPRLGMSGGSYGGGIQFVTAARDRRVDVIAPAIPWNTLTRSLLGALEERDRPGAIKVGWGLLLEGLGLFSATIPGVFSPAGIQTGHHAPQFYEAFVSAVPGVVPPATVKWFADHGPDHLLDRVRVPTLMMQGTVDTLFTLEEAHRNFTAMKRNGVPLKMMWFCGGHGICRTGEGGALGGGGAHVQERIMQWFDRHLRGTETADTGPAFEWVDEAARWHASDGYPLKDAGNVRGRGSGDLTLIPGDSLTSGLLIAATPDPLALRVPIETPAAGSDVVGEPTLKATYRATGAGLLPNRRTYVYAQVVDRARNIVVGNFATPIPITLDGRRRTVEMDLERIASRSTATGYRLEITQQTNVYDVQRAAGAVRFEQVDVTLPLAAPVTEPELTLTRRCMSGGRLRVGLAGQVEQIRDVAFKFGKRRVARDARPAFTRVLSRRTARSSRSKRLRAVVNLRDGDPGRMILARTLPRCGGR